MEDNLTQPLDDLTVVKTVSLTNALEKQIERLIVEGELAPGERLNEIQLAARFGTSRGPLREATRSLEAKGFVEVIRNRGVFVRQLSVEEALEVYDVRAALFGLRSEEHTSELQSLMRISYAVFCLKKKQSLPPQLHTSRTTNL